MNKIDRLFAERGDRKLFSLYFCAGDPTLDGTADVIRAMERRGVAMVEVGFPFSDPLADGPVIQTAATNAIRNGMSLTKLFAQLKAIKDEVSIPLVLMGYLNVVMQFGFEAFFRKRYDIHVIMLITPETDDSRVRFIDENTDGFIYMVSSASITGAQKSFDERKQEYFRRIDAMGLKHPRMIGFGISNRQTLEAAQAHAAGTIIGSKFVTLLEETGDPDKALDRLFAALE